jgi:cytochrome oxidase assembly protein ShyY1
MEGSIVLYLIVFTFAVVLAIGIWQYRKARKARKEHHRSASAMANHEPRVQDGPRPQEPRR